MRAKTGFLIGVAAGLAVVPFVWSPKPKTATVAVAVREVAAGEVLTRDDVALREVPVSVATMSLVWPADLDAQLGRLLRRGLHTGDLLRQGDVLEPPPALKEGQRAMTLELDAMRALMGDLGPGDGVDVLGTLKDADGQPLVKTIVQGLDVLWVVKRDPPARTTVMLGGTAEDIEALMLASDVTKPWLTLRAPGDQTVREAPETTIATLLGREGRRCARRQQVLPMVSP